MSIRVSLEVVERKIAKLVGREDPPKAVSIGSKCGVNVANLAAKLSHHNQKVWEKDCIKTKVQ
jgi:hypothetical protein